MSKGPWKKRAAAVVAFVKMVEKTETCWTWLGAVDQDVYGKFIKWLADRFMWLYVYNYTIPGGLALGHLCRNTRCVNPEHLEVATNCVNILRGTSFSEENAKTAYCNRGHEFTPENTELYRGKRYCVTCKTEQNWKSSKTHKCKYSDSSSQKVLPASVSASF
jgi:hypothetical protein